MSQQWRILVVEGDEYLKQNIVNSLLKDGYSVQGVMTGAEAIRKLWEDEQNLVIGELQLPDADGFDLLQWIRTYRPQTRMIMLAAAGIAGARTRALENGAVGYLEKPVDLRLLKVEVRRLLQQTGFTASLASFDLLDVIQIINMSRKSIALVVHTGLEEQGMLGFKSGELIWAEYGTLRGEEAFFALAAHKNGMVTQQTWDDRAAPNVTQPLSRLIMQALQYRSKYAAVQQLSGEYEAVNARPAAPAESGLSPVDLLLTEATDDRPFTFVDGPPAAVEASKPAQPVSAEAGEWWQDSARMPGVERSGKIHAVTGNGNSNDDSAPASKSAPNIHRPAAPVNGASITPSIVHKTPAGQRSDLPSWLMDQPTQFEIQALRPSSLTGSGRVVAAPKDKPSPAEWQPDKPAQPAQPTAPAMNSLDTPTNRKTPHPPTVVIPKRSSAEWQKPRSADVYTPPVTGAPINLLQSLVTPRQTEDVVRPLTATGQQSAAKRNYAALVSALQTLGYTLPGFIATAIVGMDGQPIAQVAVEELDISALSGDFSAILKSALHVLQQGSWGQQEDTIITSTTHHILLRVLDSEREVLQVLITTRESDPVESLEVMATVESAIVVAL
ncbi:MAG TPA: response regulator [Ktedonobacteraceae bacterium]|nr:response regulator [Ktedonobacteraceae bacterium]